MEQRKKIAIIAHDRKKPDLLAWAASYRSLLVQHDLYATEMTGKLLEEELGLSIYQFQSGPLGGDQQVGARIVQGELDALVFFWDPLSSQPHDADVKALLRIAVVWDIPVACNRASANYLMSSMRTYSQRVHLVQEESSRQPVLIL